MGLGETELDKVSHLMPTYLVCYKNQSHCSSAYARQTTQNNKNKQGWQTWSPTTTGWNYVSIRTQNTHKTANVEPDCQSLGLRRHPNQRHNQITSKRTQKRKRLPGVVSHDHLPTYLVWNKDQGDVVPRKGKKI